MIRENDHLNSEISKELPEAKLSVTLEDMAASRSHRYEANKSSSLSSEQQGHSAKEQDKYVVFGDFQKLYGGESSHVSDKGAHDFGKGAHTAVEHMSDVDFGKAVQDWFGNAVDAGKHIFEGMAPKEAPKATPEAREPEEQIKVFNPKIHGEGQAWSVKDFENWIKTCPNIEEWAYPDDEKPHDIDPGFSLPMDRKGAPDIDPGFQIKTDPTNRKVIKEHGLKVSRDEAIDEILAGAR